MRRFVKIFLHSPEVSGRTAHKISISLKSLGVREAICRSKLRYVFFVLRGRRIRTLAAGPYESSRLRMGVVQFTDGEQHSDPPLRIPPKTTDGTSVETRLTAAASMKINYKFSPIGENS